MLIVGCSSNTSDIDKSEVVEQNAIGNNNVTSENTDDHAAAAKEKDNKKNQQADEDSEVNGALSESDTHSNDKKDKSEQTKKEQYIEMLDDVVKELEPLEDKAQDGTQAEMDETEDDLYERWDVALNEVYDKLKKDLSDQDMKALRKEQRNWIEKRDEYAEKEAAELKGGSLYSYALIEAKKEFTKDRCYELVEDYMK